MEPDSPGDHVESGFGHGLAVGEGVGPQAGQRIGGIDSEMHHDHSSGLVNLLMIGLYRISGPP
ncbi:hypothetical protein GCM10010343_14460 [Streptomyces avidinii]|nr:hypothetical protein GCM10010343_14460 [Streptomyces avidinii]